MHDIGMPENDTQTAWNLSFFNDLRRPRDMHGKHGAHAEIALPGGADFP